MSMTTHESVVDGDAFTVRRTVAISAPIEKVWAAITEPQHLIRWFGQTAVLPDADVGTEGVIGFDGYGDFPVRIEESDPPHTIAFRWGNDNASAIPLDEASTVFRFTLEPTPTGTQLTVVESGFDALSDPAVSMESNRGGWNSELDELIAYLEGTG